LKPQTLHKCLTEDQLNIIIQTYADGVVKFSFTWGNGWAKLKTKKPSKCKCKGRKITDIGRETEEQKMERKR